MLLDQFHQDLKNAQLEKQEIKVSTLRLLLSELKYAQIQKNADLTDQEIISVVQKELKKRKEAAVGFRSGNREDSALKEEEEAKVLENYLPAQISDEELTKLVIEAINEVGANSIADMGKVIARVREKASSSADGSRISQIVKDKLLNK
ncbi:GatB/YqeY domain-containing protein [Candidatus Daviesbacteria bacterium]|nr:GatB/YqeY domain-containing protein [Candidatus Daviesbacteria bacterium]